MNYKIIEEDARSDKKSAEYWSKQSPLTYRIAIKLDEDDNTIELKREYFYVGYNDGESIDDFYFDNETGWSTAFCVTRATYLTRNFDPEFLKEKEKELIKKFYDRLIKSEEKLKKELKSQISNLNERIQNFQNLQKNDIFIKIIRNKKLSKIEQTKK